MQGTDFICTFVFVNVKLFIIKKIGLNKSEIEFIKDLKNKLLLIDEKTITSDPIFLVQEKRKIITTDGQFVQYIKQMTGNCLIFETLYDFYLIRGFIINAPILFIQYFNCPFYILFC